MGVLIPLVLISFTCLLIWRACDGFELASEYIGRNLSEGVRGGTINAISSSLPELFTTLIALFVLSDQDGFAIGIGTTAGSALFNGMIIPALCILFVLGTVVKGFKVTSVNVSVKVIWRDGVTLILAQIVLVIILMGSKLVWWQGAILMGIYVLYLWYMITSMKRGQAIRAANGAGAPEADAETDEEDDGEGDAARGPVGALFYWLSLGPLLDLEARMVGPKHRERMKNETWNGWPLLLVSAAVIGLACYFLVKACEWLGTGSSAHPSYDFFGHELVGIGMPPMFVAVIFAAMATSVPDTIISIRDARDGDYDDAVANALGSNIFDICFALGFPLFLYTLIHGPIVMTQETMDLSGELRVLLLLLTVVGFLVYLVGRRGREEHGWRTVGMGRLNALALLAIYCVFVAFVLGRSAGAGWAESIAAWIKELLVRLPTMT
jgi:cation:H+ antiporter